MLLLAWVLLAVALADVTGDPEPRLWLAVGAAFAIAALLWWQELDVNRLGAPEEALLFVVNPFVLLGLVGLADPKLLDRAPALLPTLLAAVYFGVGWARRAAPHLVMGFALGGWAVAVAASPSTVVVGWTALALAGLAAEQLGGRPGGRLALVPTVGRRDLHRPLGAGAVRIHRGHGPGCAPLGSRTDGPEYHALDRARRRAALGAVRGSGVRGRLGRAAALFRATRAACRRPRPECLLAGIRRQPGAARVPARAQGRTLGGAGSGRRGGPQDRVVRPREPRCAVPHRVVFRPRPHRAGGGVCV